MDFNEYLGGGIQALKPLLKDLPPILRQLVESQIDDLEVLVTKARAPKFAFVGRRGAGKSSLINAILEEKVAEIGDWKSRTGKSKWYELRCKSGELHIMDTRGLGESARPDEEYLGKNPLEELEIAIKQNCPDALLFLVKGKEVDARIKEDVEELKKIAEMIKRIHTYDIPIYGVLTQVDEFSPKSILPPFEHAGKQECIVNATRLLREHLEALEDHKLRLIDVVPVSADIEFENGTISHDGRWNIDSLVEALFNEIPKSAQMQLARLSQIKAVQKKNI